LASDVLGVAQNFFDIAKYLHVRKMLAIDRLTVGVNLYRPKRLDPAPSGRKGEATDASKEVTVGHGP